MYEKFKTKKTVISNFINNVIFLNNSVKWENLQKCKVAL